jgi:uncharacterized membrane protein
MQSINVAKLNPLFFALFFGTAVVCILSVIAAAFRWAAAGAPYLLAGSVIYLVGSLLVTIAFNVPLNDALAAVKPESAEGAELWSQYLSKWTAWNHVRTITSLAAAALFIVALYYEARSLAAT